MLLPDNDADAINVSVVEASGAEIDTIKTAAVSFSLGTIANFENLTFTDSGKANLTGNGVANTLTGGAGNDTFDGGLGADHLVGAW